MFQDIKVPKRSLREVLPKKGEIVKPTRVKRADVEEDLPPPPRERSVRRRRQWNLAPKLIWIFLVLIVLVAAGFFISKTFSTVLVRVTPKHFTFALNNNAFTTPYESVVIPTIKEERQVTTKLSTGTPKKASGTITIFSNSSAPQSLIANTRFEAANGKIYRLTKAVVVPAMKSIDATVLADQAGASYNAPLTSFTIPAFKGDAKFAKFSAKSKTSMVGGSDGQQFTMSDADHAKAVAELKQVLLQKAAEQIRFQIPADFILYEDNIIATYKEELTQNTLTLSIDAQAIIFDRDALGKVLVSGASLPQGATGPFAVTSLDKLAVTVDQNSLKTDNKKLNITVKGNVEVEFTVDPDILRQKLVGASSAQAKEILNQFPGADKAFPTFQPPWIRQFPESADRIKVELLSAAPSDLTSR